ncbi:MAG: YcaO-like family protein [Deltaproteobacteria bacterium]|nr:YcaO-like family protein [Deltaproteobacteria bacterium]
MEDILRYELRLSATRAGTGHFACRPVPVGTLESNLSILRRCPMDEFMHSHVLETIGAMEIETVQGLLENAKGSDPLLEAIILEAANSYEKLAPLREAFDDEKAARLRSHSPLIVIKWSLLKDRETHQAWIDIFEANIFQHRELPPPHKTSLPFPFLPEELSTKAKPPVHIGELFSRTAGKLSAKRENMPSAGETARRALKALREAGALAGGEMRHMASLSPHGFHRRWRFGIRVRNGRHAFTFSGIQTGYGKGLTADAARASYAMEIVERISALASFGPGGALDYARDYPLVHASLSGLAGADKPALDPNHLGLEIPYNDEPLHWMEGTERGDSGLRPILIPAQTAFLFCNLDEVNLFSGLGSTGFASGNTLEQAKLNAVLEVLERDCEATTPYDPAHCFRLESRDPVVGSILASCRTMGLGVQFQDLTGDLGIPCYKCFIKEYGGRILKGTGAHLDGRKALLSALMETPRPYAPAPRSTELPEALPVLPLEELPNFSTGDPGQDLEILETLLQANGFRVVYVDLTRRDLGIPVVRVLIPGLEIMADFDRYSRVSPRLFLKYLRAFPSLS